VQRKRKRNVDVHMGRRPATKYPGLAYGTVYTWDLGLEHFGSAME
jgi:hypothetical protein